MGTFRHAPGAAGAYRHPGTKVSESMSPTLIVIGASVWAAFVWGVQFERTSHIEWPAAHRLRAPARSGRVALRREIPLARLDGLGFPSSPGHYVDLVSAIVGVSLFSGARFVLRFGGSADILRSPPRSSL